MGFGVPGLGYLGPAEVSFHHVIITCHFVHYLLHHEILWIRRGIETRSGRVIVLQGIILDFAFVEV